MRLPNVFTAVADVSMGYLFVRGEVHSPRALVLVIASSAALYTAGMVLNDVFDFAVDAKERPFRPLPSGQICRHRAAILGAMLLVSGLALGWLVGVLDSDAQHSWRSGLVATLLAGCILAYDAFLKFTPLGQLGMGACRFLNVLLGMCAAAQSSPLAVAGGFSPAELLAAAGIGVYVIGITLFARGEAGVSRRGLLVVAILVMALGVILLGASIWHHPALRMELGWYWLLLALLMAPALRRCGKAAMQPLPQNVQAAVKHSILSLIWIDAATAAAVAGPSYGLAVAALLIPALLLGRWVYST